MQRQRNEESANRPQDSPRQRRRLQFPWRSCMRSCNSLSACKSNFTFSQQRGWAERGERLLEIRQSHYVIMIWNERTHMMCARARHTVRSTTARNLCEILELRLCSAAFTQANQKPQCAYVTLDTVLCKVSKDALNCSSIKPRGLKPSLTEINIVKTYVKWTNCLTNSKNKTIKMIAWFGLLCT